MANLDKEPVVRKRIPTFFGVCIVIVAACLAAVLAMWTTDKSPEKTPDVSPLSIAIGESLEKHPNDWEIDFSLRRLSYLDPKNTDNTLSILYNAYDEDNVDKVRVPCDEIRVYYNSEPIPKLYDTDYTLERRVYTKDQEYVCGKVKDVLVSFAKQKADEKYANIEKARKLIQ